MATPENVNVDPIRAHQVWNAWAALPDTRAPVKMKGTDVLDAAAYGLLKAEFLAAQAGVVPWVPLPGGGQGVLTVGGALGHPKSSWPQPELHTLYMASQRAYANVNARVMRARGGTPALQTQPVTPLEAQQIATHFNQVGAGAAELGILPVAWLVIAAVGILASIAVGWYAGRNRSEEIELEAKAARDAAAIGSLTDLAAKQLATTGKIDPNLIAAIKNTGGDKSPQFWPYIAIGAGGVITIAAGTLAAVSYGKRR